MNLGGKSIVGRVDCWQSVYAVLRSLGKKHCPPLSTKVTNRGTASTHLLGCLKCKDDDKGIITPIAPEKPLTEPQAEAA
ncbi:MAG: hypothetical protein OXT67_12735 [Zetaproteobacteria bacterium]|nr:hypothetical protein [Zetaproteobacteria bacterium]